MERGEVHCRAFIIESFFQREPFPTWVKKNFVRVWLQTEPKRHPKLPDVPTVFESIDQYKVSDSKQRLVITYLGIWGFGSRPMVSTPGHRRTGRRSCATALPKCSRIPSSRKS